jgi:hypothetical protein
LESRTPIDGYCAPACPLDSACDRSASGPPAHRLDGRRQGAPGASVSGRWDSWLGRIAGRRRPPRGQVSKRLPSRARRHAPKVGEAPALWPSRSPIADHGWRPGTSPLPTLAGRRPLSLQGPQERTSPAPTCDRRRSQDRSSGVAVSAAAGGLWLETAQAADRRSRGSGPAAAHRWEGVGRGADLNGQPWSATGDLERENPGAAIRLPVRCTSRGAGAPCITSWRLRPPGCAARGALRGWRAPRTDSVPPAESRV